jgi:hypothetical protein
LEQRLHAVENTQGGGISTKLRARTKQLFRR